MDALPYHSYLFFDIEKAFYRLEKNEQKIKKQALQDLFGSRKDLSIEFYATLGFKPKTVFMLWVRSQNPESIQELLRGIYGSAFGEAATLTYSFFGIARESQYSGRQGRPEQTIQNFSDRLPYFIVYPFTKTTEWHQKSFEERRQIMGEHVKVGIGYGAIRQCLLYAYGIDDYEFIVSYETADLQKFQDLVIDMRHTLSRLYTQSDTPIFTCIHKPLKEGLAWL